MELEELTNRVARLVMDVLNDAVSIETIERAKAIAFTDSDFVLMLAGGNPDNLPALRALVLEELERLR